MFQNIQLDISAQIAKITFNRPKALNALNEETLHEFKKALKHIPTSVGAVILTGAGEKSFIAGADISEMKDKTQEQAVLFARLGQEITLEMERLPQPIIAAVNGYALGGGCELAMACDFILASENAIFGQPEIFLGITPFFGGCCRLQRYVGMARAKELIYSGRKFTAREAQQMGLVLEVLPQERLMARAEEIALEIGKMSPHVVAKAKTAIQQTADLSIEEGLQFEAEIAGGLFESADQQEGMSAFIEKRKPRFNP